MTAPPGRSAAAERSRLGSRRAMTAPPGPALAVAPAGATPCGETTGSRVSRDWFLVVPARHDHLAERRATANADMRLVANAIAQREAAAEWKR